MGDSRRLRMPSSDPQPRITERALPKEPALPRLYDPSVHNDATRVLKADELEAITRPPPPDEDDEPAQLSGVVATGKSMEVDLDWEIPAAPMSDPNPPAEQSEIRVSADVFAADSAEIPIAPPLELDLNELEPLPSFALEEEVTPMSSLPRSRAPSLFPHQERSPSPFPPSREISAPPPSAPPSSPGSVAPASGLTLTQRQSIPRVLVSPSEIAKLPIDHRGGFLLTHIDGMHTLEEILDICAMPAAEALEILRNLEAHRVIEFD